MQRKIYLLASVVVLGSACLASGATIHVPADQPTIQGGINAAVNGDTVLVAAGTYSEAIDFSGKAIAVMSSQGATVTILDGAGTANPLVNFSSAETRSTALEGFTIRNAARAIRCVGSSPAIRRNMILNNSSVWDGAGLYATGGAPLVEQNTFQGNLSTGDGGAVTIDGGACVLIGNSFIGNHTGNHGGAVYSVSGHTVCKSNVFIRNACEALGGAYLATSEANDSIINNTMVSNSSRDGTLALWYSTSNVAVNNIIAYNTGTGVIQQACGSFQFTYNDVYGNSGAAYNGLAPDLGDIAADPSFVDTAGGDFQLRSGSACIDAGDPDPQYNDPDGSRNDIGAFPFHNQKPVSVCQNVTVGADSACHAQASINNGSYDPDAGNTIALLQVPPGPYPLGQTSIQLIVTNNHGAADTCAATVTVEDAIRPKAYCPGDVEFVVPFGQTGVVVSYTCSVTDNCPGSTIASYPGSGSFFPIGATTVTCVATDASGNRDTCTFLVTIHCSCPKQGDIDGSGFIDVQDVLKLIQIAFLNAADTHDPQCPKTRGDVNNSGVVDVQDVLYIIKTAFTNGPNPVNPCGP